MSNASNHLFCRLGLSPSSICFWYASAALDIVREDPQALTSLTKRVYPAVARAYHVSPAAVESGLRRAVSACRRAGPPLPSAAPGKPPAQKPTVGQFLAALIEFT